MKKKAMKMRANKAAKELKRLPQILQETLPKNNLKDKNGHQESLLFRIRRMLLLVPK